jgi:hypothetical protein
MLKKNTLLVKEMIDTFGSVSKATEAMFDYLIENFQIMECNDGAALIEVQPNVHTVQYDGVNLYCKLIGLIPHIWIPIRDKEGVIAPIVVDNDTYKEIRHRDFVLLDAGNKNLKSINMLESDIFLAKRKTVFIVMNHDGCLANVTMLYFKDGSVTKQWFLSDLMNAKG